VSELGPLPGDPDTVLGDATRYRAAADAIQRAAAQLRALSGDGFRSQAVSEIVSSAAEAAGTITQAYTRYSEAADALLDYAGPMRDAHDRAAQLTAMNRHLADQLAWLRPQWEEAVRRSELPGPEQEAATTAAIQLQQEVEQLERQIGDAQRQWNDALAQLRHAAAVAADRIHGGNEFGDLNDSFWDDLGDLFDIGKLIANIVSVVLKIVSVVLTVLAVVFAVLSVVMPVFAVLAGMLFAYAQLVNVVIAVLAMLQFALNGFRILDLAIAGLAVVAAFGGAALGGALGAAAKSAAAGATRIVGEATSAAIGEIAKLGATQAVEAATDSLVDGILDLGGDQARGLYESISGVSGDLLDDAFGDDVASFTDTFQGLGEKVGADFAEGVEAAGIGSLVRGASDALRPVVAGVGLAEDAVYRAGSSTVDAVRDAYDSVSRSVDEATRDTLGPLFDTGLRDVGSFIERDLGPVLGGPDVGAQVGDAVGSRLSDVIGGLPGGDALARRVGEGFGSIAQGAHDAAARPAMAATAAGGGR
jgi:hypothetical protein